jgi:hypothetical protein
MKFNSAFGERKRCGNLLIAFPLQKKLDHFLLTIAYVTLLCH